MGRLRLAPTAGNSSCGGTLARAELVRYDVKARQFLPYLSGISASDLDISRDGQWVTYVTYPELTLWRSKVDGSERMQLAFPPVESFLPRWSPDGTQIVFTDLQPGKTAKIYMVSRDGGGAPWEVVPEDNLTEIDPTWSPDGSSIVFGRSHQDLTLALYRVEVKMHQISKIPGSEGLTSPRVSPDGRYLAALSQDWMKLMLYEFKTGQWMELGVVTRGAFGYLNWSHDGKYVYVEDFSSGLDIVRVSIAHHEFEHIVDVKDLPQPSPTWMGLATDDSPPRSKRSLTEGSSEAVCHPIRSSASSELPKTSSRMIRSVASFKYSSNTFSI